MEVPEKLEKTVTTGKTRNWIPADDADDGVDDNHDRCQFVADRRGDGGGEADDGDGEDVLLRFAVSEDEKCEQPSAYYYAPTSTLSGKVRKKF